MPLIARHLIVFTIFIASLALMLVQSPFGQDQEYHNFADHRAFLGIPNFGDVVSNLAFIIAGLYGLKVCFSKQLGPMQMAWVTSFSGLLLWGWRLRITTGTLPTKYSSRTGCH